MSSKSVLTALGLVIVVAAGFGVGSLYMRARLPAPVQTASPASLQEKPLVQVGNSLYETTGYSIFLVALSDNGVIGKLIGCGDSLVPVEAQAKTVADALTALFAIKTNAGQAGPMSALYTSTLKVDKTAPGRVDLSGSFSLGGECDNPRAEEQINATVHQFPSYETAAVYVNGKTLKDALSLK